MILLGSPIHTVEVADREISDVLTHLSDTICRPNIVTLVGICLVLHRLVVRFEGFGRSLEASDPGSLPSPCRTKAGVAASFVDSFGNMAKVGLVGASLALALNEFTWPYYRRRK